MPPPYIRYHYHYLANCIPSSRSAAIPKSSTAHRLNSGRCPVLSRILSTSIRPSRHINELTPPHQSSIIHAIRQATSPDQPEHAPLPPQVIGKVIRRFRSRRCTTRTTRSAGEPREHRGPVATTQQRLLEGASSPRPRGESLIP